MDTDTAILMTGQNNKVIRDTINGILEYIKYWHKEHDKCWHKEHDKC